MPISALNAPNVYAQSTDVAFFFLLTLTHKGSHPTYLVNNMEPVVSRGIEFQPYPFSLILPNDDTSRTPTVKITVDNVDRSLTEEIRALIEPPLVTVELVSSMFPDIVERQIDYLKVRDVVYDAMRVDFTLEIQNIMARKFPCDYYTPDQFVDLFY
jgi:hypothetical protein